MDPENHWLLEENHLPGDLKRRQGRESHRFV